MRAPFVVCCRLSPLTIILLWGVVSPWTSAFSVRGPLNSDSAAQRQFITTTTTSGRKQQIAHPWTRQEQQGGRRRCGTRLHVGFFATDAYLSTLSPTIVTNHNNPNPYYHTAAEYLERLNQFTTAVNEFTANTNMESTASSTLWMSHNYDIDGTTESTVAVDREQTVDMDVEGTEADLIPSSVEEDQYRDDSSTFETLNDENSIPANNEEQTSVFTTSLDDENSLFKDLDGADGPLLSLHAQETPSSSSSSFEGETSSSSSLSSTQQTTTTTTEPQMDPLDASEVLQDTAGTDAWNTEDASNWQSSSPPTVNNNININNNLNDIPSTNNNNDEQSLLDALSSFSYDAAVDQHHNDDSFSTNGLSAWTERFSTPNQYKFRLPARVSNGLTTVSHQVSQRATNAGTGISNNWNDAMGRWNQLQTKIGILLQEQSHKVAERIVTQEQDFVQGAAKTVRSWGDVSLYDVGTALSRTLQGLASIVMSVLNVILEAVLGTSLLDVVLEAQQAVQTTIQGALRAIQQTIHDIGSKSIAEAADSFVQLVWLVIQIVFQIVNGLLTLATGKSVPEWGGLASTALSRQVEDVSTSLAQVSDEVSHASLTQLLAMMEELVNQAGTVLVANVDAAMSTTGVW